MLAGLQEGVSEPNRPAPAAQLTLFETLPNPLVDELKSLDLESLTPLEALNKLAELHARARAQEKQ